MFLTMPRARSSRRRLTALALIPPDIGERRPVLREGSEARSVVQAAELSAVRAPQSLPRIYTENALPIDACTIGVRNGARLGAMRDLGEALTQLSCQPEAAFQDSRVTDTRDSTRRG